MKKEKRRTKQGIVKYYIRYLSKNQKGTIRAYYINKTKNVISRIDMSFNKGYSFPCPKAVSYEAWNR